MRASFNTGKTILSFCRPVAFLLFIIRSSESTKTFIFPRSHGKGVVFFMLERFKPVHMDYNVEQINCISEQTYGGLCAEGAT